MGIKRYKKKIKSSTIFGTQVYIQLSDSCIITIGYTRGLIRNIETKTFFYIANDWAQLLSPQKGIPFSTLSDKLPTRSDQEIYTFIACLWLEGFIIISDELKERKLKTGMITKENFKSLHILSIDICDTILSHYPSTLKELEIEQLNLNIETTIDLKKCLSYFKTSRIKEIHLFINESLFESVYSQSLIFEDTRIRSIHIRPFTNLQPQQKYQLEFLDNPEGAHSYYYRRAHIDTNGFVKNSPESQHVFGNIKLIRLTQIIAIPDFQILWQLGNEKIDICRDCEFRSICVDTRPIKRRKDDSWYSTEECTYNPYIGKNIDEKGYLPLKTCGIHSRKQGFKIEVDQFITINTFMFNQLKPEFVELDKGKD